MITEDEGRAILKLAEVGERLNKQKIKGVNFEFTEEKIGKRKHPLVMQIHLENGETYEFYLDKKAMFPLGVGKGGVQLTKV